MPVRPTLLHRMALVSFLLFRKNLGNLREFFGQMVYRPPWQKNARTPMHIRPKLEPAVIACLAVRDAQEVLYTGFVQTLSGDLR